MNTFMILLFPYLDFIPFAVPPYLLFRDKLRISFRWVMFLIIAMATVNAAVFYFFNAAGYAFAAQWTTAIRYGFMLMNLILSFALIKDSFAKLMFTYLLLFAWSFFVFGNANFIESRFFWEFSNIHPYLIYNCARMLIYGVTCPFMFHFFHHTVREAMMIQDDALWRYLWIIPLFSAVFGMLYCFNDDLYAYASWEFLISRYLMLLGSCYVSYVALKVLKISQSRMQLEETLTYTDRCMMAQKKQFDVLAKHMEDMQKARHDLRQHLTVVQHYVDTDDKKGLKNYLEMYKRELPADVVELYSGNDVINALICYYAGLARDHKIRFDARIDYPDTTSISETDITVLLGNLLENAVEACMRQPSGQGFIKLHMKSYKKNTLLILLDNSCNETVTFENGIPLSSKRAGKGICVGSIKDIAKRYHGVVRFQQKDNLFCTSVMMQYDENQ